MNYTNHGEAIFGMGAFSGCLHDIAEQDSHYVLVKQKTDKRPPAGACIKETHKLIDADLYKEWPLVHPQPEVHWE